MDIRRMPLGQKGGPDTDCITLNLLGDGQVRLEGSALDGEESTAIVGGTLYASEEEAEAAGIAWAAGHGVETLYISRMRG